MQQARNIPPTGQPYAAPRVRLHVDQQAGERKLPEFVYPYDVVKVKTAKDLDLAMDHYGHPFPTMADSNAVSTKHGYRHIIEWVFPALRWFCRAYKRPVPAWLQGNGWAEGLSDKDFKKYFGDSKPLEVREWREDPHHKGKRT